MDTSSSSKEGWLVLVGGDQGFIEYFRTVDMNTMTFIEEPAEETPDQAGEESENLSVHK